MKNKILLSVLVICIALFTFSSEATAKTIRGKKTKKVVYVKRGPNKGRTVIVKKHRRGRTKVITRNPHGRFVHYVSPNRGGRSCGTRATRQCGRR